jgi:Cu-processing system permease protein
MGNRRLNRIAAVAANTFRETVRERVFYNLLVFAALMIFSGLLLARLSVRQHEKIIKDVGLACIDGFGLMIALFIGVSLVAKEIERRSLYPLLAKPLGRGEFFVGKFVGLGLTLAVNVGAMSLGLLVTLWAAGVSPDSRLLSAVFPIYLSLLLVVALAMFFSTVSSPPIAAMATLGLVIAGRLSDVIRNAGTVLPAAPKWLLEGVYYLIPNFRNFDFKDAVAYGDPVPLVTLGWVSVYAILYMGVVLLAGSLAFRGRDLK